MDQGSKGRGGIQTLWGDLDPHVDLAPLVYLLVLYGVIYFLPFGVFDWWRKGEDGVSEWLQFVGYFVASICSFVIAFRRGWNQRKRIQSLCWLLLGFFCFYVAGEEISWAERLTGFGLEVLKSSNAQGESNLHNLFGLQGYLHVSFIAAGLFFGWLGWRFFPGIEAWPAKRFSLYFLFVAAFYFYWDLSWIAHGDRIRNDQEAIEILMAWGLMLHALSRLKFSEKT